MVQMGRRRLLRDLSPRARLRRVLLSRLRRRSGFLVLVGRMRVPVLGLMQRRRMLEATTKILRANLMHQRPRMLAAAMAQTPRDLKMVPQRQRTATALTTLQGQLLDLRMDQAAMTQTPQPPSWVPRLVVMAAQMQLDLLLRLHMVRPRIARTPPLNLPSRRRPSLNRDRLRTRPARLMFLRLSRRAAQRLWVDRRVRMRLQRVRVEAIVVAPLLRRRKGLLRAGIYHQLDGLPPQQAYVSFSGFGYNDIDNPCSPLYFYRYILARTSTFDLCCRRRRCAKAVQDCFL